MRFTKLHVKRVANLGEYESRHIDVEVELEPGEDGQDAAAEAMAYLVAWAEERVRQAKVESSMFKAGDRVQARDWSHAQTVIDVGENGMVRTQPDQRSEHEPQPGERIYPGHKLKKVG